MKATAGSEEESRIVTSVCVYDGVGCYLLLEINFAGREVEQQCLSLLNRGWFRREGKEIWRQGSCDGKKRWQERRSRWQVPFEVSYCCASKDGCFIACLCVWNLWGGVC